jgi:hypothetical protein
MDHRWDQALRDERATRRERERFRQGGVVSDPDVERRDRLRARERKPTNMSPWEIGASYWNQRDLYTRNANVDDSGYARGPQVHPEIGSYAYPRGAHPRTRDHEHHELSFEHERAAFPWANYPVREARFRAYHPLKPHGFWHDIKDKLTGFVHGSHEGKGPKNWTREDASIREDVCEVLAYGSGLDVSDVDVLVRDAEVTLEGTVPDRRTKRVVEDMVEDVRGVRDVHNRLRVRGHDQDDIGGFGVPVRVV